MSLTVTEMEDILSYLPNWRLGTTKPIINKTDKDAINPFLTDDEITDLGCNFVIDPTEVEIAYKHTLGIVTAWLGYEGLPSPRDELEVGIRMWCAGRLYIKHNIRLRENVDEDSVDNYGDRLVSDAKDLLRSYRFRLSFI